jgi:cytochrome c2
MMMARLMSPIKPVILAAGLVTAALSVYAQNGVAAAGDAFAREACNACHVVDEEQRAPRLIVVGPAFRDIANTSGRHHYCSAGLSYDFAPKMPNLILTPEDRADVIAYTLSLRSGSSS